MEKSGTPFFLKPSQMKMTHTRKIRSVAEGLVSLIWTSANRTTYEILDPIKIPIYGGLMGYRIFIIHRDTESELAAVKDLETLRSFTVGQGIGWDDVDILRNAGFEVMTAQYDSLFKMVERKRFKLFSRGVQEAYSELEVRKAENPTLDVDKYIGLHYPKAVFIYVRKGNWGLKQAITAGLEKAYEDGSFTQLFRSHLFIRRTLERANIATRRWFELENPFLDKEDLDIILKYSEKELSPK